MPILPMEIPTWFAVQASAPAAPGEFSCSTWDFFFNPSAYKQCQVAKEQAQIQTVASNAARYYGPDSPTAQTAAVTAAQQSAQAPADVANVADYYGAGSLFASTPTADSAAAMPLVVMAALIVGSLLLVRNL